MKKISVIGLLAGAIIVKLAMMYIEAPGGLEYWYHKLTIHVYVVGILIAIALQEKQPGGVVPEIPKYHDNLSKEMFWDSLFEQYPKATKEFCDFVDKYKEERKWNALFGSRIKYHHLPIELQVGVWIAFQLERGVETFNLDCGMFDREDLYDWVSETLRDREITINYQENLKKK